MLTFYVFLFRKRFGTLLALTCDRGRYSGSHFPVLINLTSHIVNYDLFVLVIRHQLTSGSWVLKKLESFT